MQIDQTIVNFFLTFRTPAGIKILSIISWLGEWTIIVPLALIIVALFWIKQKKDFIWPFLTAVFGGEITGQILKMLVHRPRPLGGIDPESTFSFPSGHAIIAVTFYGFLTYYFWQKSKSQAQKYFIAALGIILILLIGFSRLYLGVHYLSDVLAGYVVGLIWLWVGIYLDKKNNR